MTGPFLVLTLVNTSERVIVNAAHIQLIEPIKTGTRMWFGRTADGSGSTWEVLDHVLCVTEPIEEIMVLLASGQVPVMPSARAARAKPEDDVEAQP
jgi:hypothetical protein